MTLQLNSLAGVIALVLSSAAVAHSQPSTSQTTSTTTQQTPSQTQSTTTRSTTTAIPATPAAPAQSETTTVKSTAVTPTTPEGTAVGPTQSSTSTTTTTATADTQGGGAAKPATAADVKAGVTVYDASGVAVGKIESVSGKNAVLASGDVKASIPISSFAKNAKGLVIGMTKAEFEAAAKKK